MNAFEFLAAMPGGFGILSLFGLYQRYSEGVVLTATDVLGAMFFSTLFLGFAFGVLYIGKYVELRDKEAKEKNNDEGWDE